MKVSLIFLFVIVLFWPNCVQAPDAGSITVLSDTATATLSIPSAATTVAPVNKDEAKNTTVQPVLN
jgi:hypothetical protein